MTVGRPDFFFFFFFFIKPYSFTRNDLPYIQPPVTSNFENPPFPCRCTCLQEPTSTLRSGRTPSGSTSTCMHRVTTTCRPGVCVVPSPTTRRTTSPSETWSPGPPLVKGTPVATRRTSASSPSHGGKQWNISYMKI